MADLFAGFQWLLCHLPGVGAGGDPQVPGPGPRQWPGLSQDPHLGPLPACCHLSTPQAAGTFFWFSLTFTLVCFSILPAGASSTPPGDDYFTCSYFVIS